MVLPDPGGETIMPQSFSLVASTACAWCGKRVMAGLNTVISGFACSSLIVKGIPFSPQKAISFDKNPRGKRSFSDVSPNNLKYLIVP